MGSQSSIVDLSMVARFARSRWVSVAFGRYGNSIRGRLRTTTRAVVPTWRASTREPSIVY